MNVQPLQLRSLPQAEAQVRERLGQGLSLHLGSSPCVSLQLRLAAAPFTQPPATAIDCACGPLWLDDAPFVLGQLSACPAVAVHAPHSDAAEGDWYWPLYNHYLAAPLQTLLSPLRVVEMPGATGLDCLLELQDDTGVVSINRLRAPTQTLLNLLRHPGWQAPARPAPDNDWPLVLPLLLGHCPLHAAQLADLQPGDVVLAQWPLFTPEGDGSLDVGRCRLHLRQLPGPSLRFSLTELEDLPMNAPLDPYGIGDSTPDAVYLTPTDDAQSPPERFDDLPLALTLRAGSLSVTLGQLRSLTPGSVLAFSGCAPGQASVYQGERALAHGDLVEIDGRLGLQITRLELRP